MKIVVSVVALCGITAVSPAANGGGDKYSSPQKQAHAPTPSAALSSPGAMIYAELIKSSLLNIFRNKTPSI